MTVFRKQSTCYKAVYSVSFYKWASKEGLLLTRHTSDPSPCTRPLVTYNCTVILGIYNKFDGLQLKLKVFCTVLISLTTNMNKDAGTTGAVGAVAPVDFCIHNFMSAVWVHKDGATGAQNF